MSRLDQVDVEQTTLTLINLIIFAYYWNRICSTLWALAIILAISIAVIERVPQSMAKRLSFVP